MTRGSIFAVDGWDFLLTLVFDYSVIFHLPSRPLLPLCVPKSFSAQLSSFLLILSFSLSSMQEWEVLLGNRLALSFQEAECRPRVSGCKNK